MLPRGDDAEAISPRHDTIEREGPGRPRFSPAIGLCRRAVSRRENDRSAIDAIARPDAKHDARDGAIARCDRNTGSLGGEQRALQRGVADKRWHRRIAEYHARRRAAAAW